MRILMLIDTYPPTIGGAQRHVRDLSIELAARGHDVSVVTFWNQNSPEFEEDEGVRVYRIRGSMHRLGRLLFTDQHRSYAPPFPDPEAMLALRRIIAIERPEVVHAHNWLVYTFLPIKRWSGARLVWTLHDFELSCAKWTFMYDGAPCSGPGPAKCLRCATDYYGPAKGIPTTLGNWAMNLPARMAVDMFLPVSHAVAEGSGLVGSRLPYEVIPNFVRDDVATLSDDSGSYTAQLPDQEYLLFVGALTRVKGVGVLLDAYAGLTNAPPLVLIGSVWPETPTELPRNVVMLKNWPHAAVMSAWQRSMLGFVPSIWPEPSPTVAMEAMAAGKPVIASRIGGLTEIVADGETGFLLPPSDVSALRQAIQRLLDEPALRERMGQAAKRNVTEFLASTVIPRIERVYREITHVEPKGIVTSERHGL